MKWHSFAKAEAAFVTIWLSISVVSLRHKNYNYKTYM